MKVCLERFPMPPSVNKAYANNFGRGRGRFKTKDYRDFEKSAMLWAIKNQAAVMKARAMVAGLAKGEVIRIESVFMFDRKSIITLDGRPKRLDCSNRIKILDDVISSIIHIDDCMFWAGSYEKRVTPHKHAPEFVDITLSVINF